MCDAMATLRVRERKDGTVYTSVLYRHNGRQSSLSFENPAKAAAFRDLIHQVGIERALGTVGVEQTATRGLTVEQWLTHHIDHLTGVAKSTLYDYRSYLRNDVGPRLGAIPLASLTREDIALWVQDLAENGNGGKGSSGKTIANKHGFLSSALNAAVKAGHIDANPAAGHRLPRTERPDMVFLTHKQFARVLEAAGERWRPMMEFLVASGARYGEVAALRPSDVDRQAGTVKILRAFKRTYAKGGYELGPPKTKKSRRTINVPTAVLDKLDYSGEWLFTTTGQGRRWPAGGPVMVSNFRANGWEPALEKAKLGLAPRIHDLRHTCASWLIQSGVPLPVIQQHFGHESIDVTVGVYGHLDRRSAQQAADAIEKVLM